MEVQFFIQQIIETLQNCTKMNIFSINGRTSIFPDHRQNGLLRKGSEQIQQLQSRGNKQSEDQILHKRKLIGSSMYLMFIVAMILLSFQNLFFFFTQISKQKTYYSIFACSSFTILFLIIGKYFATFKQLLALYFLIDSLTIALIAVNIGFSGLLGPLRIADPLFASVLTYFAPITSFCMIGTVRVIIKNGNFNRRQNIIFKIVILADAMCYFGIGFQFMFFNHLKTHGLLPQIDTLYKDFSLLFVFGGLALYKQICNLHNRFDRTDKLKYTYKLVDEIEQQFQDQQNQNQLDEFSHLKQQIISEHSFKQEYKIKRKEKANITIQSLDF